MSFALRAATIVGAPFAGWALFGCLCLMGADVGLAGTLGMTWAIVWIGVSWLGTRRAGVSGAMQSGAILTSLFLPIGIYFMSLGTSWLLGIPEDATVPMFAVLLSSAPLYFWTLAVRTRRRRRASGPM